MIVNLSASEMMIVGQVGVTRRVAAMRRQRTEPYGRPETDLWGNDIESCGAEYAVSKALNEVWVMECVRDLSEAPKDVGLDVQVRWTAHENGHLPVYDRDGDRDRFFLVTGRMPAFNVRGWVYGGLAKVPKYARLTPRGVQAFWVPAGDLFPLETEAVAA